MGGGGGNYDVMRFNQSRALCSADALAAAVALLPLPLLLPGRLSAPALFDSSLISI